MQHIGFLTRLVAWIIDAIIVTIGSQIISWIFGVASFVPGTAGTGGELSFGVMQIMGMILQLVWAVGYLLYFWSSRGQTPGKMVMGIKIVSTDGGPLTLGKAFVRWIGYIISTVVFCLGFLWIIWDKEKQGWHDKIAGTYVVKA